MLKKQYNIAQIFLLKYITIQFVRHIGLNLTKIAQVC